jgi:urease accessory protein
MATVYLQSCAGGIFDGDHLELAISLDKGASLHITSQASTIIHETPDHGAALTTTLKAGAGCLLEYLPDPVILFPRARLTSTLTAALDPTAITILSDSFIWHDPEGAGRSFDSLSSETTISIDGLGLVALDRFAIAGGDLLRRNIGVNGNYRAQGSMVVVTGGRTESSLLDVLQQALASDSNAYAMASSLPEKLGYWIRILAIDAVVLRRLQQTVWRLARLGLTGREPVMRRK